MYMNKKHQPLTEADYFKWSFLHPKYWLIWLGLGLSLSFSILPYSVILQIGNGLGWLLYKLARRRVHIARVNLQKCFPEMEENARERLLKANFRSVGIGIMEVTLCWWWPKKRLANKAQFQGLEHLQNLQGQGTILLIFHFTTIEVAGALLALKHRVNATYREHKNPVFEYMQRKQRMRHDGTLLGRRDVRGMLRVLRSGGTVWYSPDQDYGAKHSIFAPFFTVNTATVTGASRLAKIGKARVVPMVATRLPHSKGYILNIYEPWQDFAQEDDLTDASRINHFLEARIKENPAQYMWLHRRFKTRPNDEQSFYS